MSPIVTHGVANNDIKGFVRNFLSTLPLDVIAQILDQLPREHVEVLLRLPELRETVIEIYYLRELYFKLAPTKRPVFANVTERLREFICIESYFDIEVFLLANPDINPRKLLIVTGADFESLKTLLEKFRARLSKIDHLEILIERYEPTNDDLSLVLSFKNLKKLLFARAKLTKAFQSLQYINSSQLEEFVLLGHRIDDWSNIKLPETLIQLDLSWNEHANIDTIDIPLQVTHIYWNQAGINNSIFKSNNFPRNLTTLMLTYNNISHLDISLLPRTLETVDLSYNMINKFLEESKWPPNIRTILLSHNLIDNEALKSLSGVEWPEFLHDLKLDSNPFTSLINLENLPENLVFLDISSNNLRSFETELGDFFEFPKFLKELNMFNSQFLRFENSDLCSPKRVKFPNLTLLNLSSCNITDLRFFEFPSSLQKLSLSSNKISDLNTTFLNGIETRSWKQLESLTDLELYFNRIQNLHGWVPPPHLKTLDMRLNLLTVVTQEMFQEGLETLQLGGNGISVADNIRLPDLLEQLSLNDNEFEGNFNVFPLNRCLKTLDLSRNRIEQLILPKAVPQGTSFSLSATLRLLDLSGNMILKDRSSPANRAKVEKFYDDLESGLGVHVTKRKYNINSVHVF